MKVEVSCEMQRQCAVKEGKIKCFSEKVHLNATLVICFANISQLANKFVISVA